MEPEYVRRYLVEELLTQKEAHDSLVTALGARIVDLENERDHLSNESFIVYDFFTKKHPELIEEFASLRTRQSHEKTNI